jgi:glycosyltransferase involved in cell wall biosynthesis
MTSPFRVDIVVPSVGRPSLLALLTSLEASTIAPTGDVYVVDDRARLGDGPDVMAKVRCEHHRVTVLRSGGRGPAAARNRGWRAADAPWVAFLDDDVVVPPDWFERLICDLERADATVAGVQGNVSVPLPRGRPTDWERNVAALSGATWITADMAYRRDALEQVGGFDERFPRAYREDADLGLRMIRSGWTLDRGWRRVTHPVAPAPWWVSVAKQVGNVDDALMDRLHGRGWRRAAAAPPGRFAAHMASTVSLLLGVFGRRWLGPRRAALVAMPGVALTLDFARRRILAGPRSPGHVAAMGATSMVVPPVAVVQRMRGEIRARALVPEPMRRPT